MTGRRDEKEWDRGREKREGGTEKSMERRGKGELEGEDDDGEGGSRGEIGGGE